jgi:hypothetical protein
MVKLQVLREDPYSLDAGRLLARCERTYPEAFGGVDAYLARVSKRYRKRGQKGSRSTPRLLRPVRALVRYR